MATSRHTLVGRGEELHAIVRAAPAAVVLLAGPAGSGRSTLLQAAAAEARPEQVVLPVEFAGDGRPWDEYGAGHVLDAVRAGFERWHHPPLLARATAELERRLQPEAYATAASRSVLLVDLVRVLRLVADGPALLLFDDVDALARPLPLLHAARAGGHRVVAATGPAPTDEIIGNADRVVRLGSLGPSEHERLLRRLLGGQPDPDLVSDIQTALGPRAGLPGAVCGAVDDLQRSGRLVRVHRHVGLRRSRRAPGLPLGSGALQGLGSSEASSDLVEALVLLLDGPAAVRVEEVPVLAAAAGVGLAAGCRGLDRLVDDGTVDEDENGELILATPGLAAALRARDGGAFARRLHAEVARRGADPHEGAAPLRPAALAGHVLGAGSALPPDPSWAAVLRSRADTVAATAPRLACRLLCSAVHHDPRGTAVDRLVALALRAADGATLREVIEAAVEEGLGIGRAAVRHELAVAAAVAALHDWTPVPTVVRAAVADFPSGQGPIEVADRWLAGAPPSATEVLDAFASPDRDGRPPSARLVEDVEAALRAHDVFGVLMCCLGDRYVVPTEGPLVLAHRAVVTWQTGRWDETLATARALVSEYAAVPGTTDLREVAAVTAQAVSLWRGDRAAVEFWDAALPRGGTASPLPLLRAELRASRRWLDGDVEGALAEGLCAWRDACEDGWGARDLLLRLTGIAVLSEAQAWYPDLLAAAESWRTRVRSATWSARLVAEETRAEVGAILSSEPGVHRALVAARDRARAHHRTPALAWMLLVADPSEPGSDARWAEAHRVAGELGAVVVRDQARRRLKRHDLRVPASAPTRNAGLGELQERIVALVERGATNRQIARELRVSEKTVANHLTRLFALFGCRTRHGLATTRVNQRLGQVGA